ncbi:MAG: hypothetical protein KA314_07105 [Chloroflexi bacterium]|nr:hypothetical protein [Chloroflexota bacterium]MBP8055593.1 hypothetical protein [Chloroflexota bacterium]
MLTLTQARIIRGLAQGWPLKSHRYLNGVKVFKLYHPDGTKETVRRTTMAVLTRDWLIYSNHKFPAAAYTLTDKGKEVAAALGEPVQGLSNIVHFDTRWEGSDSPLDLC